MSRPEHLVRALVVLAVVLVAGATLHPSAVHAQTRGNAETADEPLSEYVTVRADGSLTLLSTAPPPPASYGNYRHFGTYLSAAQSFPSLFQTLQLGYVTTNSNQGDVRIDVRASLDAQRWTEWETDLSAGATAHFDRPARFAQYRVKLFSNGKGVGVRDISLSPVGGIDFTAMDARPVAPTFKIHATRQGMVGGRTANGHRITARDHFVSLPSWRSLSSPGGNEYMVRITYNGRSSVAPVYDVGPWNTRDDYWNQNRERFKDLQRGYPEDHAAYFDGYNKGRAEKGRVNAPTAIDIGDGVWFDDLQIPGGLAVVEVTFLWLGTDPLQAPAADQAPQVVPEQAVQPAPAKQPVPAAPVEQPASSQPSGPAEVVVDNQGPAFKQLHAKVWYDSPKKCSSDHAHWTYTTNNPQESENVARWQPTLGGESLYDVYVYVPDCGLKKSRTNSARYVIQHRDGQAEVKIDQEANGGQWVSIGRYPFAAGEAGYVELKDVTDDTMRVLWYDAVKWVPVQ